MTEMLVTLKMTHQTPASHKDEDTNSLNWGNQNVISVLKKKSFLLLSVETFQVVAQNPSAKLIYHKQSFYNIYAHTPSY